MTPRRGLPVLCALALCMTAPGARAEGLADWAGVWSGTCRITSTQGKLSSVDASLDVRKLAADGSRYSWVVTYGPASDAEQRRAYEIAAVDAANGHYLIDEKNGLKIDAWMVANQIYAPFEIGGVLITTKYIRMNGGIVMELPSFATERRRRTCLDAKPGTCAHSYRLTGVQLCFLKPSK